MKLRHLLSEVAGSGMDHQIKRAVRGAVDLDEVIPAAESSERTDQSPGFLKIAKTCKFRKIKILLSPFPHIHAGRDGMTHFIEACKIDLLRIQFYRVHAASDIHAHHIRYDLVGDRHGRADRAARTGMDVGHDADFRAFRKRRVQHRFDLLDGFIFTHFGVAESRSVFSIDLKHFYFSFTPAPGGGFSLSGRAPGRDLRGHVRSLCSP